MFEYFLDFDCVEDPSERKALEVNGYVQHHSKQTTSIIIPSAVVIVETTQPPTAAVGFLLSVCR